MEVRFSLLESLMGVNLHRFWAILGFRQDLLEAQMKVDEHEHQDKQLAELNAECYGGSCCQLSALVIYQKLTMADISESGKPWV